MSNSSASSSHLVLLSHSTKRLAAIYKCNKNRKVSNQNNVVHHYGSILDNEYEIIGSSLGFPPRMTEDDNLLFSVLEQNYFKNKMYSHSFCVPTDVLF